MGDERGVFDPILACKGSNRLRRKRATEEEEAEEDGEAEEAADYTVESETTGAE